MKEYTLIQLRLPKDVNYEIDKWLLEVNVNRTEKISKADLIVELAQIGLKTERHEK